MLESTMPIPKPKAAIGMMRWFGALANGTCNNNYERKKSMTSVLLIVRYYILKIILYIYDNLKYYFENLLDNTGCRFSYRFRRVFRNRVHSLKEVVTRKP